MKWLKLFVVFVGLVVSTSSQRSRTPQCSDQNGFPCVSGHCVRRQQWCDGTQDCRDGSDEYFCDGTKTCMEGFFSCGNGRCMPMKARCDHIKDCPDGVDEKECVRKVPAITQPELVAPKTEYVTPNITRYSDSVKNAVGNAVDYLLGQRRTDYGWGSAISTSRAMIALSFTERVHPLPEDEKNLMLKQLNIQLSLDLMIPRTDCLSHLALYINALYATCQDPRNFQGKNLVTRLRTETNKVMNSNYNTSPLVLLTLCIAEETLSQDVEQLKRMYNSSDHTGSRALGVMAMKCHEKKYGRSIYAEYIGDFIVGMNGLEKGNLDIYTQALMIQASNVLGKIPATQQLKERQLPDGSFGDLLATYSAVPALLSTSLADLKCQSRKNQAIMDEIFSETYSNSKDVSYSLWITGPASENIHSTVVSYKGNKTLYDVMVMAESKDPIFKFMYDKTNGGKKVFSLAGIPNDAESGMSWYLYRATSDGIVFNTMKNLHELTLGLDKIFPDEKSNFIFWLKRN